jgi:putative membrane protein
MENTQGVPVKVDAQKYIRLIWAVSIAIPVVVALLMVMPKMGFTTGFDFRILPHINAVLNTATSVSLLLGLYFIKTGREHLHRASMLTAFTLSAIFLVSYVLYHSSAPSTPFGGEGWVRSFYFFILITHILLAIAVVPLVLLALFFALTRQIAKHKKLVKVAYPVWLYVAVTGVTVYWMIKPYYT